MRLALFGSPVFAVPSLQELARRHELVLVVTQPDKPVGRGLKLQAPANATAAKELGLPLAQPARLKGNQAFHEQLRALELDVAITAAYGKILPQSLLDIPRHGFLNIHASLLPKYRGAAPIQWALIKGEQETGISIMQTEAGLDTGPVRYQHHHPIAQDDTALDLFTALAELGARTIVEALDLLEKDELPSIPQDDSAASLAALLTKEDGRILWQESASAIYNRYRGVIAWPGSWTEYQGRVLKVHQLRPCEGSGQPGRIISISEGGVAVACGDSAISLEQVQLAGKTKVTAFAWAQGSRIRIGDQIG